MSRPSVDVVVPFAGSQEALERLVRQLAELHSGDHDTITVVDNRPAPVPVATSAEVAVIEAPEIPSSYFARNRGAERGSAEWLLFIDADVDPTPDLIDRYFEIPPDEGSAVLAGAVVDEPAHHGARAPVAVRYAHLRRVMTQDNTLERAHWRFAQTANCAVRRTAFEGVGGFRERIRSAGDADLCFRLTGAGWKIERREMAVVTHRTRTTLRKLLRQRARHGSGAAWLNHAHPGSSPRKSPLMLLALSVAPVVRVPLRLALRRPDGALVAAVDFLMLWAYELGRLMSNDATRRPRLRSIGRGARAA